MLLILYICLATICIITCLILESRNKFLFWLVLGIGIFFGIKIGNIFLETFGFN